MTQTLGVPETTPSRLVAREIRAELGRQQLSQRRLALKMGTTYQWVNRRISTGETDLTAEDVQRIADALGVHVVRLLAGWLPRMDSNHEPADTRGRSATIPALSRTLRAHRTQMSCRGRDTRPRLLLAPVGNGIAYQVFTRTAA